MRRIAFYGGSFDPPHKGHLTIARRLTEQFALDEFVFIPAYHAPHKKRRKPTSALHRHAMLCLATNDAPRLRVSRLELEVPENPYTVDTLSRIKTKIGQTAQIFFVMGADSWEEITTWREWQQVLTMVGIIVVTRPEYEIGFDHVTPEISRRISDLRAADRSPEGRDDRIYISDAVQMDVSATRIRQMIRAGEPGWTELVPEEVAKYIKKYDIYY